MAVKLSEIQNRTKTVSVPFDGETVDVCYRHNAVTPELLEKVDAAAQEDNLDVLGVMLEPVLEWWDILQDDGSRLPTDAATIKRVPMAFIHAVETAIQEAQRPPESSSSAAS